MCIATPQLYNVYIKMNFIYMSSNVNAHVTYKRNVRRLAANLSRDGRRH